MLSYLERYHLLLARLSACISPCLRVALLRHACSFARSRGACADLVWGNDRKIPTHGTERGHVAHSSICRIRVECHPHTHTLTLTLNPSTSSPPSPSPFGDRGAKKRRWSVFRHRPEFWCKTRLEFAFGLDFPDPEARPDLPG